MERLKRLTCDKPHDDAIRRRQAGSGTHVQHERQPTGQWGCLQLNAEKGSKKKLHHKQTGHKVQAYLQTVQGT
jgi:hypothetical protein